MTVGSVRSVNYIIKTKGDVFIELIGNGLYRVRVFENRVLRRIFRPKQDEVIGE
jgi:hypothetical protein